MSQSREEMPLDVLFVGGGPANLAAAIHLLQMARQKDVALEIGMIEKGNALGSHSLSGAVLDPVALKELIPDYLDRGCPVEAVACEDELHFLSARKNYKIPYTPEFLHNDGCHIISLSRFVRWLGETAESLGLMIFPEFAGTRILFGPDDGSVIGVGTGDKGIGRDGTRKKNFEPGIDITANVTVFGEGSKGSLVRELDKKLNLFPSQMPQTFETAVKEVISIPEESPFLQSKTNVIHTFGYPLNKNTKGGGFLYRMKDNRVALGLVVGCDYKDSALEPYNTFLEFKNHPMIRKIIAGGKVIQQGAKTLCSGGYYTQPRLSVSGALIVGDSASMLNTQRLKGIHTAMKSGMLAAEAIMTAFEKKDFSDNTMSHYAALLKKSWIEQELYRVRNFSQALSTPGIMKYIHICAQHLTGGKGLKDPMTIHRDRDTLNTIAPSENIVGDGDSDRMPELDNTLFLDKLTGVYLSGTRHEEDQPCHLLIRDKDICINECFEKYGNPCTRFCPAAVYEIQTNNDNVRYLKLNPSNCLHCKTCEIKDPFSNITWTCPEGGGGPNYNIV